MLQTTSFAASITGRMTNRMRTQKKKDCQIKDEQSFKILFFCSVGVEGLERHVQKAHQIKADCLPRNVLLYITWEDYGFHWEYELFQMVHGVVQTHQIMQQVE